MASARKDENAYTAFTALRAHFNRCAVCSGAYDAQALENMCADGKSLVVHAALWFQGVLNGKMHLYRGKEVPVFLCPDISVHGQAYAMLAEPVKVLGTQMELF